LRPLFDASRIPRVEKTLPPDVRYLHASVSGSAAGDTNIFSLATDLAKWDAAGRMAERDHHYIHGVELHPDARRNLVSIQVLKTVPGYLVFWGATGVTTNQGLAAIKEPIWLP
jgi:hypothetical protein